MKKLAEHRYLIRRNLVGIIGVCLCFYFSYNALFGTRSYLGLLSLERGNAQMAAEYDSLRAQRTALEARVVRLRPGSLDRDLLEEQARAELGFVYPGETTILR